MTVSIRIIIHKQNAQYHIPAATNSPNEVYISSVHASLSCNTRLFVVLLRWLVLLPQ